MNKYAIRRGIAIGMVCSMAFLCACGKKKEEVSGDTVQTKAQIDKDHIFTMDDIELPMEGDYGVNKCCTTKDGLYVLATTYGEESETNKLFKVSFETGEAEEIEISDDDNSYFDNMTCDEDGNIYIIKSIWNDEEEEESQDEEASAGAVLAESESEDIEMNPNDVASETTVFAEEEASSDYHLVKLSPAGEVLFDVELLEEDLKEYVQSLVFVKGKGVMTCCNGNISLYDMKTGEGKHITTRDKNDDYYYGSLFASKDGTVYLSEDEWDDNSRSILNKYNPQTGTFDKDVSLPDNIYASSLYAGNSYDFYTSDRGNIEAFNLGDEKTTLICDFTASDIMTEYISYIAEAGEGKLFVINSTDYGYGKLACMNKVEPSEVTDKEILTIGTTFVPEAVRKQVVQFNKSNDKYKIKIVDYTEDDTEDDAEAYSDTVKKIGLALTQGQGPDMLVLDYNMPIESYAEKGALEPLDPYFEADQDVNTSDFLQNILDATRIKGKMYSVIPSFYVDTCVASKKKAGNDGVTLKNYTDVCKNNGIDPKLGMGSMNRASAAELYSTVGSTFVDYENGTCNFNTPEFIDLLNLVKQLPEDMEETGYDYEDFDSFYRENKSLLFEYYISSFDDYQVLKKGYFGEDIVFNGFPTTDGGESFISTNLQIAMNSDCKHKDVAWEFMKSFLSDEYQKKIEWGFPSREDALEALAAKAQEKPYYIDAQGKKQETSHFWSVGDTEVEITELSKEETQELVDFIKSVTRTMIYEDTVNNIISEEAGAFYEGQKTAEEVADVIQSRVQLYLSENM
ncbi:ABC transporter substrate-binding protein [Butyrivibrio sp. INlla16]|uniref:ABC transporter substrate-binding protein n=1 Tax=Butyrivibrio sp. INlla16 TaxID=1520807 RepID=UPI000881E6F4|nr:extracellular solute-binding protein [Butyrivibrio sp. INlla16]SDB58689.1 ABC-type glycerol-3-phosphate transport system, substrate-binding protein [Butyrivibrio sp. INlla16]